MCRFATDWCIGLAASRLRSHIVHEGAFLYLEVGHSRTSYRFQGQHFLLLSNFSIQHCIIGSIYFFFTIFATFSSRDSDVAQRCFQPDSSRASRLRNRYTNFTIVSNEKLRLPMTFWVPRSTTLNVERFIREFHKLHFMYFNFLLIKCLTLQIRERGELSLRNQQNYGSSFGFHNAGPAPCSSF